MCSEIPIYGDGGEVDAYQLADIVARGCCFMPFRYTSNLYSQS